jgi:hypothetical protein
MTINSGLNGRAVRALVELGKIRNENELLRSIIVDVLDALRHKHAHDLIADALEDAVENLETPST